MLRPARVRRCLFPLAGALSLASLAGAQVPAGPELLVNAYTTGGQTQPSAAALADGEFLVAWSTISLDERGIRGRRLGAGGRPMGDELRLVVAPTGRPGVASDAAGNFVLAWTTVPSTELRAQRFASNGTRLGAEILVHAQPGGYHYPVALSSDPAGNFIVVWNYQLSVHAQRVSAAGTLQGAPFQVNLGTAQARNGTVRSQANGGFVVSWASDPDDVSSHILAQRFGPDGARLGSEFVVGPSSSSAAPSLAFGSDDSFLVVWTGPGVRGRRVDGQGIPLGDEFTVSLGQHRDAQVVSLDGTRFLVVWEGPDPHFRGVFGRVVDAAGQPLGSEFQVNTFTHYWQEAPAVAAGTRGTFVVAWQSGRQYVQADTQDGSSYGVFGRRGASVFGSALEVDAGGNRVLEAGEAAPVAPTWSNLTASPVDAAGSIVELAGPPGPTYSVPDGTAAFQVDAGSSASCAGTGDCYAVSVQAGARPSLHWDARLSESLSVPAGHDWLLHIGGSFTDVNTSRPFYPFVETLLHHGVTGGCTATTFCPGRPVTRGEVAPMLVFARETAAFKAYPCGFEHFDDVPFTNPFCRYVNHLHFLGVVGGCGGRNYCPDLPVTRQEMPVYVLRLSQPNLAPPPCGAPVFSDVPAQSPFCPWIEELARRGIVAGCGGGRYCPADPVTREQMAVFIATAFRLDLYGP